MATRAKPYLIVTCPICGSPAGVRCTVDIMNFKMFNKIRQHSHDERNRDGYKLHSIWEAAGAQPMFG